MDELTAHKAALAEIGWLMDNSDGVKGLRFDEAVMPWLEVRRLYMPTWVNHWAAAVSGVDRPSCAFCLELLDDHSEPERRSCEAERRSCEAEREQATVVTETALADAPDSATDDNIGPVSSVQCAPCFGGNHEACWRRPCCCDQAGS
jgi:hypothetical protein